MKEKPINESLHAKVNKKYQEQNRIYSVLYEVTRRCPCNCIHCFLLKEKHDELSLDQVQDLFGQLKKEGTVELALSGGEPFIRKDFPGILSSASGHRFFISILTTGILFGKSEAALLKKNRVKKIEFSLLGAGPDTHDSLMNHRGAFRRLIKTVKLLKETPMLIALKATVMQQNVQEIGAMRQLSERLGVYFSASLSLTPREDGDKAPQKLGLNNNQLLKLDPALFDFAPLHSHETLQKAQLICRAGSTITGISPDGDIFPCILMRQKVGNIREKSLQDIWHSDPHPFLTALRNLKEEDLAECSACQFLPVCSRCPGVSYMETGSLTLPSPIACMYTKGLRQAL